MTDTTELRTRIAEAIHGGVKWLWIDQAYDIADAVVPVVASLIAERNALDERLSHALVRWNEIRAAADALVDERDAALADLSALRVAVGQLADQLAGESQAITSRDARGFAYRIAARRLRSLLDDKDNPDGLR